MPPKPPPIPRPILTGHLKRDAIDRRKFKWETIKQLFEEYFEDASFVNEVLPEEAEPEERDRFLLQFAQGPHFYLMIFEPVPHPYGPDHDPVEALIITMYHTGTKQKFMEAPVFELDGSFDLPEENIQ